MLRKTSFWRFWWVEGFWEHFCNISLKQNVTRTESYLNTQHMWYVARAIWYHLYNLKEVKNTHGGVLRKPEKLKPATSLKVTFFPWCFSRFLNYTNGTKSRNTSHISHSLKLTYYLWCPPKLKAPELKQKGPYISSPSMDAETTRPTTPPPPNNPTSMLSIKEGYWGIPQ